MRSDSEIAVLREILVRGPISRRELGARLGLSAPSLTRLTKPGLTSGFVVEREDPDGGAVGRPSRPLDVPADWGTFVGVKLTGDALHAVVADGRARILRETVEPLREVQPDAVFAQIERCVGDLVGERPTGVGIGIGGLVEAGVAVDAPFLGWRDVEVGADLTRRLGVPVEVENDLLALAEAERWSEAVRDESGFAVLTIGAGIGYGMVVDGRVVRTRDASVGPAAHVPVLADGPTCDRGHRGCADAVLTSAAIASRASRAIGRAVTYAEATRLAGEGDARIGGVLREAAGALGTLIGIVANLSLQSTVVLAGDGLGVWELEEPAVRDAAAAQRDPGNEPLRIVVDSTGFTAWARGAAVVAIEAALMRRSG